VPCLQGQTLQAGPLILQVKTLRFFERAGTPRQVKKRYFPEAAILRYSMLEQTALNIKANGKIMSLRRGLYCKLRGTELEIKKSEKRIGKIILVE
jgi:hypothetical protein